jgi:hypothetical protein
VDNVKRNVKIAVRWDVKPVVWQKGTNVLEERTPSILTVEERWNWHRIVQSGDISGFEHLRFTDTASDACYRQVYW